MDKLCAFLIALGAILFFAVGLLAAAPPLIALWVVATIAKRLK